MSSLDKFHPLDTVLVRDDFDAGYCGWLDLKPNFRYEGFTYHPGPVELDGWGATMLSTATFAFPGTHGSMNGLYSLKLCTRATAARYEQPPARGSMGCAIKRLTVPIRPELLQFEAWIAYTAEQDRVGFSETDVRAFGFMFDIQDDEHRMMPAVRYLNSVNGTLAKRWQVSRAADVTPTEWEYGRAGGWHQPGIDPQWYGARRTDGTTDGFVDVPAGAQALCYNESDDKINWIYVRFLLDAAVREYVELQAGNRVFDLRGLSPTAAPRYDNLDGLLNPVMWVEADSDRRVFLYVDSVVVSMR